MKKDIIGDNVYYAIEWSEFHKYDRFSATRVLPDMPGILHFAEKKGSMMSDLFFFASWREGLRTGIKNLFDPMFSKLSVTSRDLQSRDLYYRYTVIDTSPSDMQDILFWLVRSYKTLFNNAKFADSERYRDISIREGKIGKWGKESRISGS
jgi:hypothetical protein